MRVAHSSTELGDDIAFSAHANSRVLSCLGLHSVDHVASSAAAPGPAPSSHPRPRQSAAQISTWAVAGAVP